MVSILGAIATLPVVILVILALQRLLFMSTNSRSINESIKKPTSNHNLIRNGSIAHNIFDHAENPFTNGWQYHAMRKGMKIYKKSMPNTPLLAFRGDVIVPIDFSLSIKAFFNVSHTLKWADKLQYVETVPIKNHIVQDIDSKSSCTCTCNSEHQQGSHMLQVPVKNSFYSKSRRIILKWWNVLLRTLRIRKLKDHGSTTLSTANTCRSKNDLLKEDPISLLLETGTYSDIMYQLYAMWPLPSRDFVFVRKAMYQDPNKSVTIHYSSTTDSRYPANENAIRTDSPFTIWTFQDSSLFCKSNHYGEYSR